MRNSGLCFSEFTIQFEEIIIGMWAQQTPLCLATGGFLQKFRRKMVPSLDEAARSLRSSGIRTLCYRTDASYKRIRSSPGPLNSLDSIKTLALSLSGACVLLNLKFRGPMPVDSPIMIDDSDPAVQYVGYWFKAGVAEEFSSTAHSSTDDGVQAILKFTGSSIAVYGTLHAPDTPGKATYSIDGKSGTTITGLISSQVLYRQVLYQSPQLENGDHTLTITSTPQGRGYWLDYFSITPNRVTSEQPIPHAPAPTPVPVPTSSTTVRPSNGFAISDQKPSNVAQTSLTTATEVSSVTMSVTVTESTVSTSAHSSPLEAGTSPITSSSSTDATSPTRAPLPTSSVKPVRWTAIIVGSVLGGALFLFIIAFFVWRRNRRKNNPHSRHTSTGHTPVASPLDTSRADMGSSDVSLLNHEALSFHKSPITNPVQRYNPSLGQETRDVSITSEVLHSISSYGAPPKYVARVSQVA